MKKETLFIIGLWILLPVYLFVFASMYIFFPLGFLLLLTHIVLTIKYVVKKQKIYAIIAISVFILFLSLQIINFTPCEKVIGSTKNGGSILDCKCLGIEKRPSLFGDYRHSPTQCIGIRLECYINGPYYYDQNVEIISREIDCKTYSTQST